MWNKIANIITWIGKLIVCLLFLLVCIFFVIIPIFLPFKWFLITVAPFSIIAVTGVIYVVIPVIAELFRHKKTLYKNRA